MVVSNPAARVNKEIADFYNGHHQKQSDVLVLKIKRNGRSALPTSAEVKHRPDSPSTTQSRNLGDTKLTTESATSLALQLLPTHRVEDQDGLYSMDSSS